MTPLTVNHRLVWQDVFDQPEGSGPDPARWSHDLGAGGWGNAELQTYTDSRANSVVVRDPAALNGRALAIRALRAPDGGYTSARLTTQGRFSIAHGRIEARLKLPQGQGIWPAFWMLGDGFGRVPWPDCGEIDIMELVGHKPGTLHGTLHGPGYSAGEGITKSVVLPGGAAFADTYHVFAVDWRPGRIDWLLDGEPYHTLSPADLPAGSRWVFDDSPFFLLLNLAVGGRWPGYPDATTQFPQEYRVDYVRVSRLD
ncbi:MAG: glycoside hydrolase family 16 protein [Verrucomicrobiota bacterium]